ncbi:MAG: NFACT RNA binding domain-containing protein [Nanoarchaeota archaeon]
MKQQNKKTPQSNSYLKYRWFFTSSGKLVIGGKNSEQNEHLMKEIMASGLDYIIMHTSTPGSPFTMIVDEGLTDKDLHEQAVFTGCFSQEWKKRKKSTSIDIFDSKQLTKGKGMKEGTFGVLGKVSRRNVELKLGIETQEGTIRAVPNSNNASIIIEPGIIEKGKAAKIIKERLKNLGIEADREEIERAIPSGEFTIK